MPEKGFADEPIRVTPRTLFTLAGFLIMATVMGYVYIFSTFLTIASFNAYTSEHDIKDLLVSVRITESQLWELEGEVLKPGGDTPRNLERIEKLQERKKRDEDAIKCIQNNGNHCLNRTLEPM